MTAAAPSLKDVHLGKAWEAVKKPNPNNPQGLPAKTWAEMPLRTRAVLVMLGASTMEDPRKVAQKPWGSLSDADRLGIATCAKSMERDLRSACCLF